MVTGRIGRSLHSLQDAALRLLQDGRSPTGRCVSLATVCLWGEQQDGLIGCLQVVRLDELL